MCLCGGFPAQCGSVSKPVALNAGMGHSLVASYMMEMCVCVCVCVCGGGADEAGFCLQLK